MKVCPLCFDSKHVESNSEDNNIPCNSNNVGYRWRCILYWVRRPELLALMDEMFRWEYSVTANGTIRDCLHGVINKFGSLFYHIDRYISFIFTMVSICAVLATLITYFLFKELRNLPGLNLICLAFSIFTSRVRSVYLKHFLYEFY